MVFIQLQLLGFIVKSYILTLQLKRLELLEGNCSVLSVDLSLTFLLFFSLKKSLDRKELKEVPKIRKLLGSGKKGIYSTNPTSGHFC